MNWFDNRLEAYVHEVFAGPEYETLRESYLLKLDDILSKRTKNIFVILCRHACELVEAACQNKPGYNP